MFLWFFQFLQKGTLPSSNFFGKFVFLCTAIRLFNIIESQTQRINSWFFHFANSLINLKVNVKMMPVWSVDILPCSTGCSIDKYFEQGYHQIWYILQFNPSYWHHVNWDHDSKTKNVLRDLNHGLLELKASLLTLRYAYPPTSYGVIFAIAIVTKTRGAFNNRFYVAKWLNIINRERLSKGGSIIFRKVWIIYSDILSDEWFDLWSIKTYNIWEVLL